MLTPKAMRLSVFTVKKHWKGISSTMIQIVRFPKSPASVNHTNDCNESQEMAGYQMVTFELPFGN